MSFIKKIKRGDKTYLAEVENFRVKGKVVQKYIRYIGREVDNKAVISLTSEEIKIDEVKIFGPLLVLNYIANKIGLPEILGEYSSELLSMVYAHCLNYKSVNNMPEWYKRTDLNHILNLEGLTESRLLAAMDVLNDETIENYQKIIFNNTKREYAISTKRVAYDVTNTYLYGKKCLIGKIGKSKEGKSNHPLIQIGLAVTQKEGIPISHKTFDGNIHDTKTLFPIIEHFSRLRIRSGLLIYDRGISSEQNLIDIQRLGWHILCGIAVRSREKKEIRKITKSNSIINITNRVVINKSTFYIKNIPYKIGKVCGNLTICYNDQRKKIIRESRYDEIVNAQELLRKNKRIKDGLSKYLTPIGRIRKSVLESSEEFDGYSCIFCTRKMPSKDQVKLYFDKDTVERAFKTLKGVTNLRPVRHWLYNRVVAHVFICYLSYLLLSILKFNLKNLKISPETALKDLESVYKIEISCKNKKHRITKVVTLTKHQEAILKSVDKKIMKSFL
ncbi:MAG: transposase [Halobacteriovoraceae bacterium]|nr:transposase [Halobacteriovoraceae bacterium]